ncbi:unnamed protein product [Macrosiphum euphorbiae]|uniref:Uncharacterized protein n=1 Tax=Macrosiphum euphorbiae TaxID=13131 RepID=A0AAV0VGN6_9HEMI|nr:unnamed protein product [Macrosiphum euphorbiae]
MRILYTIQPSTEKLEDVAVFVGDVIMVVTDYNRSHVRRAAVAEEFCDVLPTSGDFQPTSCDVRPDFGDVVGPASCDGRPDFGDFQPASCDAGFTSG